MSYQEDLKSTISAYRKKTLLSTLHNIPNFQYEHLALSKLKSYQISDQLDILATEIYNMVGAEIYRNHLNDHAYSVTLDIPALLLNYLRDEIEEDIQEALEPVETMAEHNHDFEADRMRGLK